MTVSPDTQITELTANDHACLTFGEPAELLDLTAAFIRDGLLAGLKVMWVTELALARVAPELASRGIEAASGLIRPGECMSSARRMPALARLAGPAKNAGSRAGRVVFVPGPARLLRFRHRLADLDGASAAGTGE